MKTTSTDEPNHALVEQRPDSFFEGLQLRVSLLKSVHDLPPGERENLWSTSVATVQAALSRGYKMSEAGRIVGKWLMANVPGLSSNQATVEKQLRLKFARVAAGDCLRDGRRDGGKRNTAPVLSKGDRDILVDYGINKCAGQVDFAWRRCFEGKLLSKELIERYPAPANRLHRCPKNVAKQIAAEIRTGYEFIFRPHWFSNNAAPMARDWRNCYAQEWYECDDKTLDVYCRVMNDAGKETAIRCQFLPMVDRKSQRILDFVLIGESHYNSVSIRTLIKNVCSRHGLPDKGFVFERGIWKTGKLLGNNAKNKSFAEVENFATRLGLKISHALPGRARSKIVETVIRLFDRQLVGLPGYVGNDEMHRKREGMEVADLLTFDELFSELENKAEAYNNELSNSRVRGGLFTPNQVWDGCRRCCEDGSLMPINYLPPAFEYLLGDIRVCRVRKDGIKFQVGLEQYHYHSDELVDFTNGLIGQNVRVSWFPDSPGSAVVMDLKETRHIPVSRIFPVPATAETEWDWRLIAQSGKPHQTLMKQVRQIRQRFSHLKVKPVAAPRRFVADAEAVNRAQAINDAHQTAAEIGHRTAIKITSQRTEKQARRENQLKVLSEFTAQHPDDL